MRFHWLLTAATSYANSVCGCIFFFLRWSSATVLPGVFCCLFVWYTTRNSAYQMGAATKKTRRKHTNELFNFLWMFSLLLLQSRRGKNFSTAPRDVCFCRRCELGSVSSIQHSNVLATAVENDVLFSFARHTARRLLSRFLLKQAQTYTRPGLAARTQSAVATFFLRTWRELPVL